MSSPPAKTQSPPAKPQSLPIEKLSGDGSVKHWNAIILNKENSSKLCLTFEKNASHLGFISATGTLFIRIVFQITGK